MDNKFENLFTIQNNIHQNIRFADSKAIAIAAVNLAVIGGLQAIGGFSPGGDSTVLMLSCFAFIFLTLAIFLSVLVLYPRGDITVNAAGKPICDPHKIAANDFKTYFLTIEHAKDVDFIRDISIFIYDRSLTNTKKYKHLRSEIVASGAGWGLSALAAAVNLLIKLT